MSGTIEDARQAILDSSPTSSIYVGSDSIRHKHKGMWYARYSTVVIVHKDSSHGAEVFHETIDIPDYGSMKQRLLNEAMQAIDVAQRILNCVGDRHLSIHLDLNPNPKHKSNVAIKEACGYVRGQLGLDAVVKPFAFAATYAADHCVRSKALH